MRSRHKYYRSRSLPEGVLPRESFYEETYWVNYPDPDGKLRQMKDELQLKLEDAEAELAFINAMPAGRILDVGCGMGHLLAGVDDRWERHGQDVSEYALREAQKYAKTFHGTLHEARYPDGYFNVVTSYAVVEHLPDPIPLFHEMWRILAPGGHIIIHTPDFDSGCARRFGERYRLLSAVDHITLFSTAGLRRLLEDIGFLVDHVDYPYFETRHFTKENLERLFDTSRVSPPFYGNQMTFYARKPLGAHSLRVFRQRMADIDEFIETHCDKVDRAAALLRQALTEGGRIVIQNNAPKSTLDLQRFASQFCDRTRRSDCVAFSSEPTPKDTSLRIEEASIEVRYQDEVLAIPMLEAALPWILDVWSAPVA